MTLKTKTTPKKKTSSKTKVSSVSPPKKRAVPRKKKEVTPKPTEASPCRTEGSPCRRDTSPFLGTSLQPLSSIGSGSGLLYIGDPAYIVTGTTEVDTKLATEKRGLYLDSKQEVANFDLFLQQWNSHEQQNPTSELILPAIAFQETGPGKGMVLPLNASNAVLKLRREFDENGKLVRIILDVV